MWNAFIHTTPLPWLVAKKVQNDCVLVLSTLRAGGTHSKVLPRVGGHTMLTHSRRRGTCPASMTQPWSCSWRTTDRHAWKNLKIGWPNMIWHRKWRVAVHWFCYSMIWQALYFTTTTNSASLIKSSNPWSSFMTACLSDWPVGPCRPCQTSWRRRRGGQNAAARDVTQSGAVL